MNDPNDETFEKILQAIRRDPTDKLSRDVLADRLHELGEYDLETWWRSGAERWMREFAAKCVYEFADAPGAAKGDCLTYEQVMGELDKWVAEVTGVDGDAGIWSLGCRFSDYQLTTAAQLLYESKDTDRTMWAAYEVIRGVLVPDYCKRDSGRIFDCLC